MIRRIVEVVLALFIGLSGLGFLGLAVYILRSSSRSESNPIVVVLIVVVLGLLCLTVAYRGIRGRKHPSSRPECCKCGATTEIPEAFISEPSSFGSSYRMYCPLCWNKRKESNYKRNILFSLSMVVFGFVLLKISPGSAFAYFLLNVVLIQVLEIPSIFLHELAHAWTAKKMGMHVYRICIGVGKRVFKRKLFGFEIDYRAFPIIGVVFAAYPAKENSNVREMIFVAAGPLMNAALAILALLFIPTKETLSPGIFLYRIAPWHALFWVNVLILIVNLWPRKLTTPFGIIETDGKQLVKNLQKNEEEFDRRYLSYFLLEGTIHVEKKEYVQACSWFKEGLEHFQNNFSLLTSLGVVLIKQIEFSAARECFINAMPVASAPQNEALIKNNIAYVDSLMEDPALLDEADRYSQEAFQTLSWMPSIKGTRGTVLLQLGKIDEAVTLLTDSLRLNDDPDGKAQNCCFLAIAERTRGNLAKSREYLTEARRLDPDCFLLERVERVKL